MSFFTNLTVSLTVVKFNKSQQIAHIASIDNIVIITIKVTEIKLIDLAIIL